MSLNLLARLQPQARFAKMLPATARVVDVGCGDFSRVDRYVGRHRPDLTIVGIERFENASIYGPLASEAPSRSIPYQRFACDLEVERFPFPDGSFDGAYFSHVIEHVEQKQYVLSEIARVLKPGARLYVETPGPASLRAGRPRWVSPSLGGTVRYHDDPTHLGEPYDLATLTSTLQGAGYLVRESGTVRELGMLGMPVYAAMALAGLVPAAHFETRSFFYGAGIRNLVGWGLYAIAER